jgi:hypothetical protein
LGHLNRHLVPHSLLTLDLLFSTLDLLEGLGVVSVELGYPGLDRRDPRLRWRLARNDVDRCIAHTLLRPPLPSSSSSHFV